MVEPVDVFEGGVLGGSTARSGRLSVRIADESSRVFVGDATQMGAAGRDGSGFTPWVDQSGAGAAQVLARARRESGRVRGGRHSPTDR